MDSRYLTFEDGTRVALVLDEDTDIKVISPRHVWAEDDDLVAPTLLCLRAVKTRGGVFPEALIDYLCDRNRQGSLVARALIELLSVNGIVTPDEHEVEDEPKLALVWSNRHFEDGDW